MSFVSHTYIVSNVRKSNVKKYQIPSKFHKKHAMKLKSEALNAQE